MQYKGRTQEVCQMSGTRVWLHRTFKILQREFISSPTVNTTWHILITLWGYTCWNLLSGVSSVCILSNVHHVGFTFFPALLQFSTLWVLNIYVFVSCVCSAAIKKSIIHGFVQKTICMWILGWIQDHCTSVTKICTQKTKWVFPTYRNLRFYDSSCLVQESNKIEINARFSLSKIEVNCTRCV